MTLDNSPALIEAASPDLEKQDFLAVVFIYREYSGQQEFIPAETPNLSLQKIQIFGTAK